MRSIAGRCQLISLGRVDEPRGSLCVADASEHVPFVIHRAYWIFDVPRGGRRADHAHRSQHELLIAARGSFSVHCDDGSFESSYVLDAPDIGLLLPPMVFHYLDGFSRDAVCLVLAEGPYESEEYISDRTEFRALAGRAD